MLTYIRPLIIGLDAAVPRRDCARAASAQTREFAHVRLVSDHLRRPRGAHEPFRARTPTRKLDRFAAAAQIITS
jgi:hypothetical protein